MVSVYYPKPTLITVILKSAQSTGTTTPIKLGRHCANDRAPLSVCRVK